MADGVRFFPGAGVGVEGVVEVVMAHVGVGVGPFGRAEQGEAQDVAGGVVAEFGVVDEAQAVDFAISACAREVGPLLGRDFELGLFPAIGAGGGAFDGAVGDFISCVIAGDGQREGGFEEDVGFVPVDFVVDVDQIAVEADGLDEFRALPGTRDTDAGACGFGINQLDRVSLTDDGGGCVVGARINVPSVVVLRRVFKSLQFVTAAPFGEFFDAVAFDGGNATALFTDRDVKSFGNQRDGLTRFRGSCSFR